MTRYLLDTNIISNAVKPHSSASLTEWLGEQNDQTLFIAALTVAEIARGRPVADGACWKPLVLVTVEGVIPKANDRQGDLVP